MCVDGKMISLVCSCRVVYAYVYVGCVGWRLCSHSICVCAVGCLRVCGVRYMYIELCTCIGVW